MAGFPVPLFLIGLLSLLLFGHAQQTQHLGRVAGYAVQLARVGQGFLPPIFFLLALSLGTVGAGNIRGVAMRLPSPWRSRMKPAFRLFDGAAGGLWWQCCVFVAACTDGSHRQRSDGADWAVGYGWSNYAQCLLAHTTVAMAGYLLFGGKVALHRTDAAAAAGQLDELLLSQQSPAAQRARRDAVFVVCGASHGVDRKIEIGAVALAAAVLLSVLRVSDEEQVLRELPWEPC